MKAGFPLLSAIRSVRIRVATEVWSKLTKLVFHRHPRREWGAYFRFGYRRTPWGLAISLVDLLPPRPGDLSRTSPIVSFSPDYIARAVDVRDVCPLGIGFVHSHPLGWGVVASPSDDDMDEYFARLSLPYGSSQPYLSLIVNRDLNGELVFSGRAYDHGEWLPVSHLHMVGAELRRFTSAHWAITQLAPLSRQVLARWTTLVGEGRADRSCGATLGILGCSGTGSPMVELAARAQVANFVLVDEQRLADSNLERLHGAEAADLNVDPPPYKVDLVERMIRAINPAANIVKFVGNGLDEAVIDELLRCDLVLGGTDTVHGRALLGDLSSLYLLPSIDVGVLPRGRNNRVTSQLIDVTRQGAGDACPFCQGRILPALLNSELMPPEEREHRRAEAAAAVARGEDGTVYWHGDPPQLPAVGYLTTTAGAIAAGYALNWLLGTAAMPHQRIQFDLGQPDFAFVGTESRPRPECSCVRQRGFGDQGDRSVTMPSHFAKAVRRP